MSGPDPYAYPDSNVLRNKAGLRDAAQLQGFEYRASAERAIELHLEPCPEPSIFDTCARSMGISSRTSTPGRESFAR